MDRRTERRTRDFDTMVEAFRIGTVVAHSKKAYEKWSRHKGQKSQSLSPAELENAVMRIADMFPENVVHAVG